MPPAPHTPSHWVHDLTPFLVQFNDTIGIRYYGLAYLLGFALCGWVLYRAAQLQRLRLPPNAIADLMTALVVGVLAGGRLGYFVLYEPQVFFRAPWQILQVWDGGMSSHGGFVGVGIALAWFARRQKIQFLHLSDAVVAVAPLGVALGRLANFNNGELWGKISDWKYAVIFPTSAAPGTPVNEIAPRHASQLYQSALEGFLLLAFLQWRFWCTPVASNAPGRITGEFLIGYAIARIIGEYFREPDASLILGLSRGTFYSLFMIVAGGFLIWLSRRTKALPALPPS
jgi:phosphatidylglycerol:prolipoprotein diacylglycerol transferase